MGWLRTMGKRVALRVSAVVARNELFERYGERPVQPPLEPGTWSGSSDEGDSPQQEPGSDDEDEDPQCSVVNVDQVRALLNDGPMVIH